VHSIIPSSPFHRASDLELSPIEAIQIGGFQSIALWDDFSGLIASFSWCYGKIAAIGFI